MSPDKTELRQLIPTHLGAALDGIAMADGMERCHYVQMVLEAEVRRRAHAASVVSRVLRGNPYSPDTNGAQS